MRLLLIALAGILASGMFHSNPRSRPVLGQRRTVTAKTTNYTITAAESDAIFTTEGAGGEVVFTLPPVAAGLEYTVYSAEDQDLVLAAPVPNTMIAFNDVAASQVALSTADQKVGGGFNVWSDGNKWMVAPLLNPGAGLTGEYIAFAGFVSAANFKLLFNQAGVLSQVTTYDTAGTGAFQVLVTPDTNYFIVFGNATPHVTLLHRPTADTVAFADSYALAGLPNGIQSISPEGNYLAVAHSTSPYLTLLSLATPGELSLVTTYDLGATGLGCAFSPDGNYLATQRTTNNRVTLLNHTTPGVLSLADIYDLAGQAGGNGIFAWITDDYLACAHSGTPYLTLLDHTTPGALTLATTYTLPNTGAGCALSPNGNYLAVASQVTQPYFTLLDARTAGQLSFLDSYNLGANPLHVSWSTDGGYIGVGMADPGFTLLDHSTPGTVAFVTTYDYGTDVDASVFTP